MNYVKQAVHADNVYKYGLSGKNVTVAIMDTGIAMHRDFDNRILVFRDFCEGRRECYDDNGHGTHVAGIIAGSGGNSVTDGRPVYGGIAPQAGIVMLKVLDRAGNGKTEQVLAGIRWLREHRDAYQIRLLNISVGMLPNAGAQEQRALLAAVDGLWDAGIAVVAAAGNNGPRENTVTIPGISRKIITVGSADDGGNVTGGLGRGYSGAGPTECCILKPEILAPGTNIMSCSRDKTGYVKKSGTSMAAPVVTGALALVLEKYPYLTPAELKLRLYERAYPRGEHIGKKCWGVLHVDYLLRGSYG